MRTSLICRAAHARTPMIKFLGKRSIPKSVDHTPQPHPASPTHELPESFASYRTRAQQHGPLGGGGGNGGGGGGQAGSASPGIISTGPSMSLAYGAIGGTPGRNLGPIKPKDGEYFDVTELPKRFQRRGWTDEEIDAITSAGASMW